MKGASQVGNDLESWIISRVGRDIYDIFFKGYTQKQWGKRPADLPAAIVKRIPIRYTYNDNYFDDYYQGIPIGGYSPIFQKLLARITVQLNTDYLKNRAHFDTLSPRVLYTGPLDKFFDYRFGKLEYRSLRFEHERYDISDYQGVAQMNFTSADIPYTRIVEHKHFEFGKQPVTWITREYPAACADGLIEMYPVRDGKSLKRYDNYRLLAREQGNARYYFGGRLADELPLGLVRASESTRV
jgi:UDP-galactopyranose mutase